MRKVLILDTSILCVWLEVPGKINCGPNSDQWDNQRVAEKIHAEEQNATTFVLPLASIIETGNHIAQARHSRRERSYEGLKAYQPVTPVEIPRRRRHR